MTLRRKEPCLPDENSNTEYTQKDVESVITALDELPFAEKMGYLALVAIMAVFSEAPADQHHGWEGREFTDEAYECECIHIDNEAIREALRHMDSEIVRRCTLSPPLMKSPVDTRSRMEKYGIRDLVKRSCARHEPAAHDAAEKGEWHGTNSKNARCARSGEEADGTALRK